MNNHRTRSPKMNLFYYNYLQELKADLHNGKLLMECIIPTAYDWLSENGLFERNRFEMFMQAANEYRAAWLNRHPRSLHDSIQNPVIDQKRRSDEEQAIKVYIAKKMAVYEYVRSLNNEIG
jgi:hypothetical protein